MHIYQNAAIKEFKWKLVGRLGRLFIDSLFSTVNIEYIGYEKVSGLIASRRFIAAVWHSRILLVSYLYKKLDAAILVSNSEDGEIIARILQYQGHETIRGSTTRGGLRAISKLIKSLKDRIRPASVIPDGPQGPRFIVQPGIITLAKKTGYPILPMTYSAKKIKVFSSWDRFILPFPFTKCRFIYGNPLEVPPDAGKDAQENCRIRLEKELCRITDEADRYFSHWIR